MKKLILFFILISLTLAKKVSFKIPRINTPPRIDGEIDDIYKNFLKLDDFQQFQPKYNESPSERTEFYIGYDSKNLYVAFKA